MLLETFWRQFERDRLAPDEEVSLDPSADDSKPLESDDESDIDVGSISEDDDNGCESVDNDVSNA